MAVLINSRKRKNVVVRNNVLVNSEHSGEEKISQTQPEVDPARSFC